MTELEKYIVEHINDKNFKFPKEFDPSKEYTIEFYEEIEKRFIPNSKKRYFYRFIKRTFDFIVSFISILLLSFFFLFLAIAIKIDSRGPVFFKQDRIGKEYKSFKCFKFRSMSIEAPHDVASNELQQASVYVTKIGKFMRKVSIDELAQLFNILSGKMSIISYRPIILKEVKLNEMRNKLGVFSFKPGITGYSQVHGRDNVIYQNKALMDAYYVKNASLWFDIKLICESVFVVLTRKGNKDNK